MSGVYLRPARSTDAGTIGGILQDHAAATAWLPQVYTGAEYISFAGAMIDKGWVTVAQGAARVSGFVAREERVIQSLYVTESERGQGIGAALVQGCQAQCSALSLWTHQANRAARTFYAAHGFYEAEMTDGAGNDDGCPDVRLVWTKEAL